MRTKFIYIVLLTSLLFSCAPSNYFQVYEVKCAEKNLSSTDTTSAFVFENEDCKFTYNFWAKDGDAGFVIQNKTSNMIYLNMKESFFVKNGFAYDYFKNQTVTNTTGDNSIFTTSQSTSYFASSVPLVSSYGAKNSYQFKNETSVSAADKEIISVPPKTSKFISVYSIDPLLYRDCDLLRYPNENQIKDKTFTQSTSPVIFSNILSYKVGKSENAKVVEHKFYVESITNVPENIFVRYENESFCGETVLGYYGNIPVYKYKSPTHFYKFYTKDAYNKELKH